MNDQVPVVMNGIAANDQAYHDEGVEGVDALQAQERYQQERLKRLRPETLDQFVDPFAEENWRHFTDDPWLSVEAPVKDARQQVKDNFTKVLILGAGYGGLIFAVRFIDAGIKSDDIRLVDTAGGFGGTWYWNRYPGLMCDVESYTYMPLLEETGHVPKHRYAYGPELREHANRIADKWNLTDKALFQTQVNSLFWNEERKAWRVGLVQSKADSEPYTFEIYSQFVVTASGLLNWPHLPRLPGLSKFNGHMFHTARWDYKYTEGSPEDPSLTNLQDKVVAIIGTGATAVQCIPHLARWAKHLYVFQRTPSSIDIRDQRETDIEWFKDEVTKRKSWQRARIANLHGQMTISKDKPKVNLIDDQWSKIETFSALIGSTAAPLRPEEVLKYLQELHAVDLVRMNGIRDHIKRQVKDPKTAEALLPWYPSWCKRPCFHDDYLPTFNRPNVTLVDTNGQGVSRLTTDSIILNDKAYPVDLIILSTGFRSPGVGTPAERSNASFIGRDGRTISETWATDGILTLHGAMSYNFPNLFFPGPMQAGASPNQMFILDSMAQHAAYIVSEAERRVATAIVPTAVSGADDANNAASKSYALSPTLSSATSWSNEVVARAAGLAGVRGCTPSYFNLEGALDRAAENDDTQAQMKAAKSAIWGQGVEDFVRALEEWRGEGGMRGIEIG
ncbi:MAG: hypothetical protein Q9160_005580 [Pyrenula sp. 1 TL-2023]